MNYAILWRPLGYVTWAFAGKTNTEQGKMVVLFETEEEAAAVASELTATQAKAIYSHEPQRGHPFAIVVRVTPVALIGREE